MNTSSNGVQVLHHFEGCKLTAYPDPGSKDGTPWTIGYGDTGPHVTPNCTITQDEADIRFAKRLTREFEPGVRAAAKNPNQGQFDAMVCLAYNIGLGNFKASTLLKKFNASDIEGAEAQFPRWNKNDGKVMLGLTRRRAAEQALFRGMNGDQAIAVGAAVR